MRERMKKKKNMIIGGLLAVVFLMSVGYAAFASNLNITGTANTSSWIIKITNIREKSKTAGVTNKGTSYTDLTANFNCELTLPGDSITYEVTVENQGNIDASLKEVTKSFTNNKYIDVTYSGLYEGQMLYKKGAANSTAIMEVTVTFLDKDYEGTFTDTITSNISLNLNFEQEGNNVDITKKYLVEYDSRGGTPVESRYFEWDDTCLGCYANTKKAGYSFGGWFTNTGGAGIKAAYNKTTEEVIQDQTQDGIILYADWSQKRYTLQFDKQTGDALQSESIYWTEYFSTPNDYAFSVGAYNNGYRLEGWYTSPNGKGLKMTNNTHFNEIIEYLYEEPLEFDASPTPITIYANWKENEYVRVDYDANDYDFWDPAENVPDALYNAKCTDKNLVKKQPTSDEAIFKGWYVEVNGVQTPFTNNNSIKQVFGYCPAFVTIYADWEVIE